ncbi:MAG: undecaprenyl-diphosphate phosphatase [Clostridiales bacterium]|nr:undecaprenyl-diphosphate phosphatase [Clostridiales bacterium]
MSFWDYFVALIFGIVEGITEWLPISSTGHMILLNEFLKINVSEDFFDLYLVVIQLGAICAVIVLYWKELWPFGTKDNEHPLSKEGFGRYIKTDIFQMWFKILVACIPAAIVGVFLDDWLDEHLYNFVCVAIALIVFGIIFIVTEYLLKTKDVKPKITEISQITYRHALIIGVFQLIAAIFPGTSRSGTTIVGSLMMRISRRCAAKFTFFLAVPVMLGASLLKILKFDGSVNAGEIVLLVIGMISAFFVSLFVIKALMGYIRKHNFNVFAWYRIALGILVLVFGILGLLGS